MVLKRPLQIFNGFWGDHHHWMFFGWSDHCHQLFYDGFLMLLPSLSMVFDGSGPLVKRCDGFDGSLWSIYHTPLLSKIWGLGDKILFVSEVRIESQISIMEIWIWLPIPPWRKVLGSGSRFTYWLLSIEFGCLSHRVLPSTRSDPKTTNSSYSF